MVWNNNFFEKGILTPILMLVFSFQVVDMNLKNKETSFRSDSLNPYVVVLGIAQDAGYPHPGCNKSCCKDAWLNPSVRKMVSCIALVDPQSQSRWIFDATPDFPKQLYLLDSIASDENRNKIDGIFLTHAHIGHYTGLMYLGREAMNANKVPVYVMPDMHDFLKKSGPWNQLIKLENIVIKTMKNDSAVMLNAAISVTPFFVPHRHEYTEAVGYRIKSASKSLVFIPDIDKWKSWERDIIQVIKENDYLLLDGTFFENGEIAGRSMSEIPHPFIAESIALFKSLIPAEKSKIHFIHLNHTNPVLREDSEASKKVRGEGYDVAREKQIFKL